MSTSSIKRQIRRFHVVVVQCTSKKCTKKRDACAELLFSSLNLMFFFLFFCFLSCRRRRRLDINGYLTRLYFEICIPHFRLTCVAQKRPLLKGALSRNFSNFNSQRPTDRVKHKNREV